MTKRLVLTLLFGIAALMLSSCGNPGNEPSGESGIPAGKNTAKLFLIVEDIDALGRGERAEVAVNGIKLGSVKSGERGAFTFVPHSGENVVELIGPTKSPIDRIKKGYRVQPGDTLVVHAFCVQGPVPNKSRYVIVGHEPSPKQKAAGYAFDHGPPFVGFLSDGSPDSIEVSNLTLEETPKLVFASEEIVSTPLTQEIEQIRTIDQTIDVSEAVTIGGETGINAALVAKITVQVEHRQGRQFRKSESYRRKVTVPGDGRKFKLIWYDLVRRGTVDVKYTIAGQPTPVTKTIPFQYKEAPILKSEEVK